jgi:nucleoid-associated protein EbfC
MFDMLGMMGKIKDVQSKIKAAKDNVVHLTANGESGAGLVKVGVNGNRQVVKLDIDASLIVPADKEMLQDLTLAAVNQALKEIDQKIADEMKKATEGMLPNIPGMDLNSLLG